MKLRYISYAILIKIHKLRYFFEYFLYGRRQPIYPETHRAKPCYLPKQSVSAISFPKKKIKRKGLQGYRKYKTFSQMDFTELSRSKRTAKKSKNWDIVCKGTSERMIIMAGHHGQKSHPIIEVKAALIIELADILFEQQKYDDAAKWYAEFTLFHPGSVHVEYASYRAIVCASKKILSIDRDQSATEKHWNLLNHF